MILDQWIERYRGESETADADEVIDLFTPDAFHRSSAFRAPHNGSDAIRHYWQRGRCGNTRRPENVANNAV